MSSTKLILYFDCVSPYTLLAYHTLTAYKKAWNLDLVLKPFFLGGIMVSTGNQPPATLPQKAVFMAGDLQRNGYLWNIKILDSPTNFFSDVARKVLLVQRVLCSLQLDKVSPDTVEIAVRKLMDAIHVDPTNRDADNNLNISDELIIKSLKLAGLSETQAKKALSRTKDADVKKALEDNTKEAVEAGAFGSPTMLIHGGIAPYYNGKQPWMTFGSDRFEQIAKVLGKKYDGPVGPASLSSSTSRL
jgi:glutathione S-transferase kappa 1